MIIPYQSSKIKLQNMLVFLIHNSYKQIFF